MIRVSEINIADETKRIAIETPADALRLIYNEYHREQYIAEFGDVVVEYDAYYKRYTVPAFKVQRAEYSKLKQAYCDQHGSN